MPKRRDNETGIILDSRTALMKCQVCGALWSPCVGEGGRMPHHYRECFNGCTRDEIK